MLEMSILNVVFFLLAGLAAAIVVVLIIRWIANDPARKRLLFWWFITLSTASGHGTVATQGPFVDQAQCEWARGEVNRLARVTVAVLACWSDGR